MLSRRLLIAIGFIGLHSNFGCLAPVAGTTCEKNGSSCEKNSSEGMCIAGSCETGMLPIPSGSFFLGCSESDTSCYPSELPRTAITVDDFAIDTYEVTLADYEACVDANICAQPLGANEWWSTWNSTDKQLPVSNVSWHQADDYCAWRGRRLCSEAEWEFAARGFDSLIFPWGGRGDENPCDRAVLTVDTETACGEFSPMPVGSKVSGISAFGALDMAGNVSEWVADCWHADHDGRPLNGAPWSSECPDNRFILKGGDLSTTWQAVRSSYREGRGSDINELVGTGVRCCKSL